MQFLLTKTKKNWTETNTTVAMQHKFTSFESIQESLSTLNKVKNTKPISVSMVKTHWYGIWYILQH